MAKKHDLSCFECDWIVGARRAGVSILETCLLEFSSTMVSKIYT